MLESVYAFLLALAVSTLQQTFTVSCDGSKEMRFWKYLVWVFVTTFSRFWEPQARNYAIQTGDNHNELVVVSGHHVWIRRQCPCHPFGITECFEIVTEVIVLRNAYPRRVEPNAPAVNTSASRACSSNYVHIFCRNNLLPFPSAILQEK